MQIRSRRLANLRKRLDEPVSWRQKRRLIEVLLAGVRVDTVEECGVNQNRVTVTYRFSQPDQRSVIRIPTQLKTVGDHVRKKRLGLKMLQKEVVEQLGVCQPSVFNWEANTSAPEIRYMPAVIRFLGYNPLPPKEDWASRLVQCRTVLGLTQKGIGPQDRRGPQHVSQVGTGRTGRTGRAGRAGRAGSPLAIMLVGQSDSLLASRRSSRAQQLAWRKARHVDT